MEDRTGEDRRRNPEVTREYLKMFVKSLETTITANGGYETAVIEQPTWSTVGTAAVRNLDGDSRDSVIINGPDEAYMGIVGGTDGNYVVAGMRPDAKAFILTAGERRGKWVPVAVGGQENEYADNEVVTLEQAPGCRPYLFRIGGMRSSIPMERKGGEDDDRAFQSTGNRAGPASPPNRARTASASHAKAFRPRRQVSMTVSIRSTNRLPDADWVPKESFRQMTA